MRRDSKGGQLAIYVGGWWGVNEVWIWSVVIGQLSVEGKGSLFGFFSENIKNEPVVH
jgi:hypothetical protein